MQAERYNELEKVTRSSSVELKKALMRRDECRGPLDVDRQGLLVDESSIARFQ